MKTAYAPDNTRSSIIVVLSLAAAAVLIAALIGLSEKPDVDVIGLAAGPGDTAAAAPAGGDLFGFDVSGDDDPAASALELDQSAVASDAGGDTAAAAGAEAATESGTDTTDTTGEPSGDSAQAIVVPTAEPTATPDIAAAVEPTPVVTPTVDSTDADDAAAASSAAAPGLPTTSGSVQGTFFTRPDEDEGAIVTQNLITVTFAEDGSGSFQGVLDITYEDGTHILLNMSGPLVWTATTPQVKAVLEGAYTYDAPIDADDVESDDAELSITSLESGSGSLCTPKCFGFTFPPQTGL